MDLRGFLLMYQSVLAKRLVVQAAACHVCDACLFGFGFGALGGDELRITCVSFERFQAFQSAAVCFDG